MKSAFKESKLGNKIEKSEIKKGKIEQYEIDIGETINYQLARSNHFEKCE